MPYVNFMSAEAARACEWLGAWVKGAAPTWPGPPEVIIYVQKIVIALRDGEPIDVVAPPGCRIKVRIAPGESPPASLHEEIDEHLVDVVRTLFVPPSLATLSS